MESAKRPKKVLTAEETVVKATEYLLESTIVQQDLSTGGSLRGRRVLFISSDELPRLGAGEALMRERFNSLLQQCIVKELDRVRYCIAVHNRANSLPAESTLGESWERDTCDALISVSQDVCAMGMLRVLADAAVGDDAGDLFSHYTNCNGAHGDLNTFLELVSGWASDGMQLPPQMLRNMLRQAKLSQEGRKTIVALVKSTGKSVSSITRLDELLSKGRKHFDALQCLIAQTEVTEIVGEWLLTEVAEAVKLKGDYFQNESLLGPLLSTSTMITTLNPRMLVGERYSCFVGMRNFPNPLVSEVEQCQSAIQDGLHRIQSLVYSAFYKMLKTPENKNNALAWLSAVISLNEVRAGPKFELKKSSQGAASDGFLLNYCSVLLQFCKPFFSTHSAAPKLHLITPDYPSSSLCRLDLHNEPCLASGIISAPDRSKSHDRFLCEGGGYKFVTECFFITLRALHIGLLVAAETFLKTLSDVHKEIERKGGSDKLLKDLGQLYLLANSCCLLDPQLVQYCSEFYITNAVWLTRLMESCHEGVINEEEVAQRQRKLFSTIPEFGVKDMVIWFLFILRTKPRLLLGLQLTPFVDCCISLLERPDLLPGPVAQSKIISVLLACVGRDRGNPQRLLRSDSWTGIQGDLSAMVQGSPTFRDRLGPALLHTFAAVDVVEGLDVDKENFDKYSARYDITQLLLHLWGREDTKESIVKECSSRKFQGFLGAIFDTLLYTLNDSLGRVMNIHKIEQEKEDTKRWSSLPAEERAKKDMLATNEIRVSKGLLTMSNLLLQMLVTMTDVDDVTKRFCSPPLSIRVAAAVMGFLDNLCGPRQAFLRIKDPDRVGFDAKKIVSDLATIIARIYQVEKGSQELASDGFVRSLSDHPDFSRPVLVKVASVVQRHMLCDASVAADFTGLMEKLDELQGAAAATSGAASGPGDPLAQASSVISERSGDSWKPGTVAAWQREAEAVEIDQNGLREMYVEALKEGRYDCASLQEVHALESRAVATLDPRSPRVRAILRDMKLLEESPVHPDSGIFIRQDEDRMDLVRVLITGPVGTPYSYGCFVFDIYYPANYPVNPPLVLMITTGNGTIRFNPNLYADGKVCLSLLGTWHGGDSSEKWDATHSNLLQVVVSIQGLILIPEPIYNEPGYEAMQGTPQGKARSTHYNAYVQVNTIRYAMLEALKNPPVGFEDTIRIHFLFVRDAVLQQCSKWLRSAISRDHEQKLHKAIEELRVELDKL